MSSKKGLKGFLNITLIIFSGWFGEFSFIMSWIRVLLDTLLTGYLRASPIVSPSLGSPKFSWWYGLSWRVGYHIGSNVPLNLIGFALLVGIIFVFKEFLKEVI